MRLRAWLCVILFAPVSAIGKEPKRAAEKTVAKSETAPTAAATPALPEKLELGLPTFTADDPLGLPSLTLEDASAAKTAEPPSLPQVAPPSIPAWAEPGSPSGVPFSPVTALSASGLSVPLHDSAELFPEPTELPPDAPAPALNGAFDLMKMAVNHGPAVLVVKSWDKFGSELGSSIGFFVSADGKFFADGNLIAPEQSKELDYFTAIGADGTTYVVKGVYGTDAGRNILCLQADGQNLPHLPLAEPREFKVPRPAVIAGRLNERDISMSEVAIVGERSVGGRERWWELKGRTESASPGSPIVTEDGKVLGIVTMHVPGSGWVNYAVSAEVARQVLAKIKPNQKPLPAKRVIRGGNVVPGDDLFAEAREAYTGGSFERAAQLARRMVAQNPRSGEAWGFLGLCQARSGNAKEALPCFEKAVNLQPDNPALWSQLSLLYRGTGNVEAELDALTKVLSNNPSDNLAWLFLGELRIRRGEIAEAYRAFDRAVSLLPDSPHAFFMLAYAAGKCGDLARAEGAALQCARLEPNGVRGWYLLGLIYKQGGRMEKAAKAFQETVERSPNHPKAWLNYAHALKATGNPVAAKKAFQTHLANLSAREAAAKPAAPAASPGQVSRN